MSEPVFLLQIVTPAGTVVRLPGGGPLERDLIRAIADQVVATWNAGSFDAALSDLVQATKWTIRNPTHALTTWRASAAPKVRSIVEGAAAEVLRNLKWETRRV